MSSASCSDLDYEASDSAIGTSAASIGTSGLSCASASSDCFLEEDESHLSSIESLEDGDINEQLEEFTDDFVTKIKTDTCNDVMTFPFSSKAPKVEHLSDANDNQIVGLENSCGTCSLITENSHDNFSEHFEENSSIISDSRDTLCRQKEVKLKTLPASGAGIQDLTISTLEQTSFDSLADSCDEDECVLNKPVGEDQTGENTGSLPFHKWDPTSWPAWFERLFINHVSPDVSLKEDEEEKLIVESTLQRTPSISKAEFNCGCCLELMVEPTTIQCGHSFCRQCLANWYFGSNSKRTCPQCRQSWNGNPQTNVILKSTIRTLWPAELQVRELEFEEDYESMKKVKRFDAAMVVAQNGLLTVITRLFPLTRGASTSGFLNGCIFSISAFLIMYLAFAWRHHEAGLSTVTKPLADWKVSDVAFWLESLGAWTRDYQGIFEDNAIDGQLVLALTDRDLQEAPFSMKMPYHRRAFLAAVAIARSHGAKPPTNLWEYKAAHPGTALLLLWGLKSLPRHTILGYMMVFAYDSILVPFIHITCPGENSHTSSWKKDYLDLSHRRLDPAFWELQPFRRKALIFQSLSSKQDDGITSNNSLRYPSLSQWLSFVIKALLLPHFLVADFVWDWLDVHFWTTRFILVDCLFLSIVEVLRLKLLCQRNFAAFFTPYSAVLQEICLILVVSLVWRFLPSMLCDVIFYSLLYIFPFLRILNCSFRLARFFVRPH